MTDAHCHNECQFCEVCGWCANDCYYPNCALVLELTAKLAALEGAAASVWTKTSAGMPELNQQVLVRMREGVGGDVCDVACYIGRVEIDGGGTEDRWIMADIRLDTRQISHWATILPPTKRREE